MKKVLHITHPEFNMSAFSSRSKLLTNVHSDLAGSEYHTSLGDLPADDIISIVRSFDSVNFIKDKFDLNSVIAKETITLLTYLSHFIKVSNFEVASQQLYITQNVQDRPDEPVIWVFGCSHSHGVGLKDGELRYSDLLSHKLNRKLISCTQPGSSTSWSLRHLLEADIRSGDLVIWQITTAGRLTLAGPPVKEIQLAYTTDRSLHHVYNDEQIFFNHMNLIRAGVKYLRAKNVQFIMTSIEEVSALRYEYLQEYVKYPEYCYSPNFNIDLGTDNLHVGPKSHKRLASILLDRVYYINEQSI